MRPSPLSPTYSLLPVFAVAAALVTAHPSHSPYATPQSTCIARTINYITHSLPQQCLTSLPASHTATPISDTISATAVPVAEPIATPTLDPSPAPAPAVADDDDDGNDLSTGAFMSFEEWKVMMVAKAEDGPDSKHRRAQESRGEASNGDFASLGDEGEINLDFDAYANKMTNTPSPQNSQGSGVEKPNPAVEKITYEEGLALVHRSKDAGKTCKERFSYSSFDAGATVLKTSPGTKNPKAILAENKDSYMLLECATENKFFIVELSDDILVDTIVLANYEFFSSMIRAFRVSVSDRYPVKAEKWKVLGTFQARNARDIQPFLVEHPQDWARYLRVEILSHWGNEFYCPLSLLRVHGTRMMDAWKELDSADIDADEEILQPLAIEDVPKLDRAEVVDEVVTEEVEIVDIVQEKEPVASPLPLPERLSTLEQTGVSSTHNVTFAGFFRTEPTCRADCDPQQESQHNMSMAALTASFTQYRPNVSDTGFPKRSATNTLQTPSPAASNESSQGATTTPDTSIAIQGNTIHNGERNHTTSRHQEPAATASSPSSSSASSITEKAATIASPHSSGSKPAASDPTIAKAPTTRSQNVKAGSNPSASPTQRSKASFTVGAQAASPTVQDSFFKAMTKRLQILESNSTLSLQYIESQSRFLQEALAKLEKRQVNKVDHFLHTLNNTVLNELRLVRTQSDEIWQSTIIALETQREQAEREIVALGARVGVLADEVVFQKRMAIVQSILLLICLVLVIFSRGFAGNAAGLISGESGYYPGQAFASGSRFSSPGYPATPKSPYQSGRRASNGVGGVETPPENDATPNARLIRAMNNTSQLRQSLGYRQQSGSNVVPREADQGALRPAPSLSRATTASDMLSMNAEYYEQLPTPASSRNMSPDEDEDMGYDSEPDMTPGQRERMNKGDDVFYFSAANSVADENERVLDQGGNRQLTPPMSDGASVEEDYISRPVTSGRSGHFHAGATRKPLPALPEDPD